MGVLVAVGWMVADGLGDKVMVDVTVAVAVCVSAGVTDGAGSAVVQPAISKMNIKRRLAGERRDNLLFTCSLGGGIVPGFLGFK